MMSIDLGRFLSVFPLFADRVEHAIRTAPNPSLLADLFNDIAQHVQAGQSGQTFAGHTSNNKKRKLAEDFSSSVIAPQLSGSGAGKITSPVVAYECKDVSVQIPARKKLKLQLVADTRDERRQEVRLKNQQSGDVEYVLPAEGIDQAFCLPVPEKQQRQWSFALFPKSGAVNADGKPCEQAVFTMNETAPTGVTSADHAVTENDTFISVTESGLNRLLRTQGKRVVFPAEAVFASSIPQPHRKGEKAYHVKAHRGSKEGVWYFMVPRRSSGLTF